MTTNLRDADLTDLVAGVVEDARSLVTAEVGSLKLELSERLTDLGDAIRSWLIVACLAIVTTVILGLAIAATLTQVGGMPWYGALWIVTGLEVSIVIGLVFRARAESRKVAAGSSNPTSQLI
ncbi:MAG: hypothetical protein JWP01_3551 [Myxococcales bacterium]|nr:hypothetical protein [Myxococcales bacterium]